MFFGKLKDKFRKRELQKRVDRLSLKSYNKINLEHQRNKFEVRDITNRGLAFMANPNEWKFELHKHYEFELNKDDHHFKLDLEIRHFHENIFGATIHDKNNEYKQFVNNFFYDEISGLSATKIEANKLQENPDGIPTWYFFDENYELYTIENSAGLVKFKLSILGTYMEFNDKEGMYFAHIEAGAGISGLSHKQSDMLKQIDKPSPDAIWHALKFVDNIPQLPENHKEHVKSVLNWYMGSILKRTS